MKRFLMRLFSIVSILIFTLSANVFAVGLMDNTLTQEMANSPAKLSVESRKTVK